MPSFFDKTNFINNIYALNIAIENHFGQIFDGDLSRMIYASNQYAFRKRVKNSSLIVSNLHLPFINYYLTDISLNTDRQWFNHILNVQGVYIDELGKKMKVVPIQAQYESTLFIQRFDDSLNAFYRFLKDNSNETVLYPSVTVNEQEIDFTGVLSYNFSFNTEYNELDWLEQNNIYTIALDFNFNTQFLYSNEDGFGISDEVILEFLTYKTNSDFEDDDPYETLKEYFDINNQVLPVSF